MANNRSVNDERSVLRVLQTKGETKAFYNKIARVYDLLAEHSEQPVRETAMKMLAPALGEHLLEIGCGTGHVLAGLAQAVGPTGRVFSIDISENMLVQARGLLERESLMNRVTLDCGDAENLPYPSDSLDGIFMSFTLELLDTPEIPQVLAQCKRVLRPGGRIVVAAVSKEAKQGLVVQAFEWTHRHFPNLMDCRPIYVHQALEAEGFAIEDCAPRIHVGPGRDRTGQEAKPIETETVSSILRVLKIITTTKLTSDSADRFGYPGKSGVVVAAVANDSIASLFGIRLGMLIEEIDRRPTKTIEDFKTTMEQAAQKPPILFLVNNQGSYQYIALNLPQQ